MFNSMISFAFDIFDIFFLLYVLCMLFLFLWTMFYTKNHGGHDMQKLFDRERCADHLHHLSRIASSTIPGVYWPPCLLANVLRWCTSAWTERECFERWALLLNFIAQYWHEYGRSCSWTIAWWRWSPSLKPNKDPQTSHLNGFTRLCTLLTYDTNESSRVVSSCCQKMKRNLRSYHTWLNDAKDETYMLAQVWGRRKSWWAILACVYCRWCMNSFLMDRQCIPGCEYSCASVEMALHYVKLNILLHSSFVGTARKLNFCGRGARWI